MALTNRYPRVARPRRDYPSSRPTPRKRPVADNDNRRNRVPANDNVPSPLDFAPLEHGLRNTRVWRRLFRRLSPYGYVSGAVGLIPWLLPDQMPNLSSYGFQLICRIAPAIPRAGVSMGANAPNACGVPAYSMYALDNAPPIPSPNGGGLAIAYTSEPPVAVGGDLGVQLEEWWRPPTWQGGPAPGAYPPVPQLVPGSIILPPNLPEWQPMPHPWIDPLPNPNAPTVPPLAHPPYNKPHVGLPEASIRGRGRTEKIPTRAEEPQPLRRPRRRERERKIRIADMPDKRMRRLLGWLISAASEGGDFLDSLYDALPDSLRSSDDDTAAKFNKVFFNLDKVDFTEAVQNLIANQVEDRYFGKGFGDMTSALEDFGVELPSLKL